MVLDLGPLQVFEIPPASNLLSVMGCHTDSSWIPIFYSTFAKIALNAFPIQDFLEQFARVSEFQIMNIIMISGDSQAPRQTKNRRFFSDDLSKMS